jgi:electron transfer flavoprotein alpha subunit
MTAPEAKPVVVQTLVLADSSGGWSRHALELLGDASTLAKRLSGCVGAWFVTANGVDEPPAEELAAFGCDLLLRLTNDRFRHWSSEAVCAALAPHVSPGCRVIFLPGNARGEEVAALLAERLDIEWIPDVLTLSVTRTGTLEISASLASGRLSRLFRPMAERPVIFTMRAGVAEPRQVSNPAGLEMRTIEVDLSKVPTLTTVERSLPADPRTIDLVFAQRIVAGGRGTGGAEGLRLVGTLADALHASVGVSRMVVDLGWAPYELQVGQTGRTVRPDLYVACGISGASHHVAGMRASKHIVAINPDRSAPIHDVAHLSLFGDMQTVIPAIQAELQRRDERN